MNNVLKLFQQHPTLYPSTIVFRKWQTKKEKKKCFLTGSLGSSSQNVGSHHGPHPQQTHHHGYEVDQLVASLQEEPGKHHQHWDHKAVQQLKHNTATNWDQHRLTDDTHSSHNTGLLRDRIRRHGFTIRSSPINIKSSTTEQTNPSAAIRFNHLSHFLSKHADDPLAPASPAWPFAARLCAQR